MAVPERGYSTGILARYGLAGVHEEAVDWSVACDGDVALISSSTLISAHILI